jgi:predicted ATPase/DNA-binding CsgD family transcriptional regulator
VGNLPVEVTRFIGRRHEVSAARRLLTDWRLVTLTGPGGVGKSRLAVQVAAQAGRAFPDGTWLIDLAGLREPQLLAQSVVDTLGIRNASARPAETALADYLADKSLLLVLDNCEHLLEACAALGAAVLRSAPRVRVLATSRQALNVDGEHVLAVPPMAVPDPRGALTSEQLLSCDAAALFADRALAVAPDFTLDARTGPTVALLVHRLDGIPLAIEMAVVWLRALPMQELLDRLTDALRWLTAGSRSAPLRQRTLRATIDWSFGLCSPMERTLWARLSVFAGGFDLPAAEAVCSGDGIDVDAVVVLLDELVDKNIVVSQQDGAHRRFRLLETIRQYGRERLARSGDEARLCRQHRDWYERLVTDAGAQWHTQRQLDWFSLLRCEHANLRAAFEFCLTMPGEARTGLRMACALRSYWHASGAVAEGRRWMDRLLALDPEPSPARAEALRVAAFLALFHNDVRAAQPMVEQATALAERFDDAAMLAWAVHVTGFAALFTGEVLTAIELFERALVDFRARQDTDGTLIGLFYLTSALTLVDPQRAEPLGKEAVTLSRSLGEHWMRAWILWTLGVLAWRRGDTQRAIDRERDAIRHKQLFDDRFGVGQCVEVLAWSAATDGQHDRAVRLLGGLSVIWREVHARLYRHLDPIHDEVCRRLREAIGQQRFDAAFAVGARMTYDQIVNEALGEQPAGADHQSQAASILTRRESEIADLIARGMSNKEIGAALVISKRTVDTHVEHILAKLGFTSRAQVATWVIGQREAATEMGRVSGG